MATAGARRGFVACRARTNSYANYASPVHRASLASLPSCPPMLSSQTTRSAVWPPERLCITWTNGGANSSSTEQSSGPAELPKWRGPAQFWRCGGCGVVPVGSNAHGEPRAFRLKIDDLMTKDDLVSACPLSALTLHCARPRSSPRPPLPCHASWSVGVARLPCGRPRIRTPTLPLTD